MKRWISLLLALTLAVSLTSCGFQTGGEEQADGYLLCYVATNRTGGSSDAIEQIYLPLEVAEDAPTEAVAAAVVEQMLRDRPEEGLKSPLPAGTRLLGVTVQDRRATVDVSTGINRLEGVALTLADYCLTLALTALDGIYAVSVTVDGQSVAQQPKQVFYERDVLLSTMDDVVQTVEVTLYYLDGNGALSGERRTLEVYEGQTMAENLVLELLNGPESRDLTAVLPENFQINSVRVDSGVCYVNLPAASLESLPPEPEVQQQMLWSLADSLYSLENVQELKLLSGGVELEQFGAVPVSSVAGRPQG